MPFFTSVQVQKVSPLPYLLPPSVSVIATPLMMLVDDQFSSKFSSKIVPMADTTDSVVVLAVGMTPPDNYHEEIEYNDL